MVIWISRAEVGKFQFVGKTGLNACFYKALLKHSHIHLCTDCVWLLLATRTELSSFDRDCMTYKVCTIWPFTERFAHPVQDHLFLESSFM